MQKQKNILVFTTWSFKDGLIQAATVPYLKIISEIIDGTIYLICLEQPGLRLTKEEVAAAEQSLTQHRIRLIRFNYHKNKLRATADWGLRIAYLIFFIYLRRITHLHPMCAPAAGLAWIVNKFKKTELIVDSFEPHAELMAEMGIWSRASNLFRLMFLLEKKVVNRADKILAVSKNISCYIKEHYNIEPPEAKILYRPLCVNPDLFSKHAPDYSLIGWTKKEANTVGVYTGKIGGMYYDEEFYLFIKECIKFWKGDFHLIMCTSMDRLKVEDFFLSHGIEKKFFTITFVTHTQVPEYLCLADFGMSFSRPSDARKYGCPTKNAEYWAEGLPVITTNAILDDTNNIVQKPYLGIIIDVQPGKDLSKDLTALSNLINKNTENQQLIRNFAIEERSFKTVRNVYEQVYA